MSVALESPPAPSAGATDAYRRLPGRSWSAIGKASLWRGDDHVLHVQSRGYSETYRRFYFREIQALVLRRTARTRNWVVALAALSVLLVVAAMVPAAPGATFWAVLATPFLIALFVQGLRGPSCVVHVRTAIETTELSALCRLRPAERALAEIAALVESAQGVATLGDFARMPGSEASSGAALSVPLPSAQALPPPLQPQQSLQLQSQLTARSLRLHYALFLCMFVDAGISAAQFWAPGSLLAAGALAFVVAEFLIAISALVKGRRLQLDRQLRRATVAVLVYLSAAVAASWVGNIVNSFQAVVAGTARPGIPIAPASMPWVAIATLPITLVLGTWGLLVLRRLRASGSKP